VQLQFVTFSYRKCRNWREGVGTVYYACIHTIRKNLKTQITQFGYKLYFMVYYCLTLGTPSEFQGRDRCVQTQIAWFASSDFFELCVCMHSILFLLLPFNSYIFYTRMLQIVYTNLTFCFSFWTNLRTSVPKTSWIGLFRKFINTCHGLIMDRDGRGQLEDWTRHNVNHYIAHFSLTIYVLSKLRSQCTML